jgi:hypothetical protein
MRSLEVQVGQLSTGGVGQFYIGANTVRGGRFCYGGAARMTAVLAEDRDEGSGSFHVSRKSRM